VVGLLAAIRRVRGAVAVLGCLVIANIANARYGHAWWSSLYENPRLSALFTYLGFSAVVFLVLLVGSAVGCVIARWSAVPRRASGQPAATVADAPQTWVSILLVLIALGGVSTVLALFIATLLLSILLWRARHRATVWPVSVRYGMAGAVGLALLGSSGVIIRNLERCYSSGKMQDWTNNAFFRAAHDGNGMLVCSGNLPEIQLRSRRPVVLIREMNFLPYFPHAGPDMDRTLRAFFGFGLADPPRDVKASHPGLIPSDVGRDVWENRPPEEWQRLADEFQLSGVICPDDWKLKLPLIAQDLGLALYGVSRRPPMPPARGSGADEASHSDPTPASRDLRRTETTGSDRATRTGHMAR
jgi:hypothetical protein